MADQGEKVLKQMARHAWLALCLALSLTRPAAAQEAQVYDIDLSAQSVPDALNGLSEQTGVPVLFPYDLARDRNANPVRGRYTLLKALELLLYGTGLSGGLSDNGVLMISLTKPDAAENGEKAMKSTVQAESKSNHNASVWATIAAFLATVGAAPNAAGQSGASAEATPGRGQPVLEEILVTAQRREQTLMDVPMSIVALGSSELDERRISSMEDLVLAVPGFSMQDGGGAQRRYFLRGVGNVAGTTPLVGIYLDEIPLTSSKPFNQIDLRPYDLERVEVLRGPQGTLYGEGSTGGTVRFITKAPDPNAFLLKTDVAASFTHDGAPSQRINGVINVPLLEDTLGLRLSGVFENAGGWMEQPAASQKNINDRNIVNVRAKGLWQPSDALKAYGTVIVHRMDGTPGAGEDENGHFIQTFNLTTTPSIEENYEVYNLLLTYDFDAFQFLSSTSHMSFDKTSKQEKQVFQLAPPPAAPFDVLYPNTVYDDDIFSQEVRLSSRGEGPWKWLIGGFYRDTDFTIDQPFFFGFPPLPATPFPAVVTDRSESWAVFGETSVSLGERFEFGAGLRYFEDERENIGTAGEFQSAKFDSLSPRAYVNFDLTKGVMIYGSLAKGFRSGGFNNLGQPTFEPETLWTYELGTKMSLADGRFTGEISLFYSDYKDYIVSGILPPPAPPLSVRSNAGDASIKGIEWALGWLVGDSLEVNVSGNYLDTEFEEIRAASTSHLEGDRLDWIPKYSITISGRYGFVWLDKPGFLRLDYNEQGEALDRNRTFGPHFLGRSDVINMLNMHINWQWSDSLSLGLFAQNLLNERGYLDPFEIEDFASRARPRTVGFQVGVTFE